MHVLGVGLIQFNPGLVFCFTFHSIIVPLLSVRLSARNIKAPCTVHVRIYQVWSNISYNPRPLAYCNIRTNETPPFYEPRFQPLYPPWFLAFPVPRSFSTLMIAPGLAVCRGCVQRAELIQCHWSISGSSIKYLLFRWTYYVYVCCNKWREEDVCWLVPLQWGLQWHTPRCSLPMADIWSISILKLT